MPKAKNQKIMRRRTHQLSIPPKNETLRKTIKELGYTQRLVAYMAEMDYGRLNAIINGWIRPNFIEKQILSSTLDKSVKDIFPKEDTN